MADHRLTRFKEALTRLGARLSAARVRDFRAVVEYIEVGNWLRRHTFTFDRRVDTREDVWREIIECVNAAETLYLEFGVFEGAATRFWASHLKNPKSRLVGFDSFEGLPEDGGVWTKGQFDVAGRVPVIADERVSFRVGWFNETLPGFLLPSHTQLVLNLDADLYSSTAVVLRHLREQITIGTYLYFDEFCKIEHEARAFEEFIEETGYVFRPVAADRTLTFVAFQRVA